MFDIDIKSSTPIYEQITNKIKSAVVKGYLKHDDILPSVRKLSSMLNINPNTVAKAYNELERQGVIVTVRGRGTFINSEENVIKKNDIKNELKKIQPILTELKYKGLSDDEILNQIKTLLIDIGGNNND